MVYINLYDINTIDSFEWPRTQEGEMIRGHLLPMLKEGVQRYIGNIETKLYLLQVNSALIPITVNQKEYNNSYLTSNYFPIKYLEEQLNKEFSVFKKIKKSLLKSIGLILKVIKINKAVIINNWLVTTNIYPQLTNEELQAIIQYLTERFRDYALILRSLNEHSCSELLKTLSAKNFRLLFARMVSIYDPQQKANFTSKVLYHHRRDRRLIASEGYEVENYYPKSFEEIKQLLHLYNLLYLEHHTKYSPQYTEKFLSLVIEKGFLDLVCLKKGGEIKGVIGFHEREGVLIAPFCGYDQKNPEANIIYRMLTIVAIDEAEKRNVILNDGSGGEAPKKYRGMQSFPEYVAIYDRHLSWSRRLFWSMAEKIVKIMATSTQKNQLKQKESKECFQQKNIL